MRKGLLLVFAAVLMCFIPAVTALADYGYTSVSQIPMAVDFSVSVVFESDGRPRIVTDYPFEAAGADELNLLYRNGQGDEAFVLNYRYPSGATRIGSWNGQMFRDGSWTEMYRTIRDGEVKLDDHVWISTDHFNQATDWVLKYSNAAKEYIQYSEKTFAQAFDAMGNGGVERTVYYSGGEIDEARLLVRREDADLVMYYNRYGEISSGFITQYAPDFMIYDYDLSTGLFGGYPVTEFGFEEEVLETEPLAAISERTGVSTSVVMEEDVVLPASDTPSLRYTGGLLAGVMMGLALFYSFRRWRNNRRKEKKPAAEPAPADGSAAGSRPEETVEPAVKYTQHR